MNPNLLTEIAYEERNGVAWVTLNRPHTHNALSEKLRNELHRLWRYLKTNDAVRCIVLTGAGTEAFCTGLDRSEILSDPDTGEFDSAGEFDAFAYEDPGIQVGPKTNGLWKPVIAAVNGMACGGAFYLLGEAEFIIAAEHATFFDPHVSYGMPAVYEPIFMSGRMAFGDLMRMSLLGLAERMSAATARECGLVSEVVPAEDVVERARWAAEAIAAVPGPPVQATVRAMWAARRFGVAGAIDVGNPLLAAGMRQQLMLDGQDRFRARTRPQTRIR